MDEGQLLLMSMAELRVLRGRTAGSFTLRHARAGSLLSGSSSYADGSLMWHLDAFDRALAQLRLPLPGSDAWVPVGLYDPVTFEVAVGPLPATVALSDAAPVAFEAPLLPAVLQRDPSGVGLLLPSGRRLSELEPDILRASALTARGSGYRR